MQAFSDSFLQGILENLKGTGTSLQVKSFLKLFDIFGEWYITYIT